MKTTLKKAGGEFIEVSSILKVESLSSYAHRTAVILSMRIHLSQSMKYWRVLDVEL